MKLELPTSPIPGGRSWVVLGQARREVLEGFIADWGPEADAEMAPVLGRLSEGAGSNFHPGCGLNGASQADASGLGVGMRGPVLSPCA